MMKCRSQETEIQAITVRIENVILAGRGFSAEEIELQSQRDAHYATRRAAIPRCEKGWKFCRKVCK